MDRFKKHGHSLVFGDGLDATNESFTRILIPIKEITAIKFNKEGLTAYIINIHCRNQVPFFGNQIVQSKENVITLRYEVETDEKDFTFDYKTLMAISYV